MSEVNSIKQVISTARLQLETISSDTARLESELLLATVLEVERSYLYIWPDKPVAVSTLKKFQKLLRRRLQLEPIAYILGYKDFWKLRLQVNKHTLIPRPETELLVDKTLELLPANKPQKLLDLGTGSGAIACALAIERPNWQIIAIDNSVKALELAAINVKNHNLSNIEMGQSHWYQALTNDVKFNAIISNPPYVAISDSNLVNSEIAYEPESALVSKNNGLEDIEFIISNASKYLLPDSWLLIEHGYDQAKIVYDLFKYSKFINISQYKDLAGIDRVSCGLLK